MGDGQPIWTDARSRNQIMSKWCENLWKEWRLTHQQFEEYLFLSRDGVISPKRNLDAESRVKEELQAQERNATVKRVRARFDNFERVPEATAWLFTFREERDRYAFLIIDCY